MSGLRGRIYASHTFKIRILVGVIFSLIVVGSICTLFTFPNALAASIVSDDFNDNSLDTGKWDTNLFSGFTNTNVPLAETSQRLEIGPLLKNVNGPSYRGLSTVNTYSFVDSSAYVELAQAPASNSTGEATFTVGSDLNDYYRMYVSGGNLIGLIRRAAGRGATEDTLFTIPYDSTNHRFLRIRNDSGNLYMDTAPGTGGTPGTWTQQYTETWNSQVVTSAIIFEIKAGTSAKTKAPGTVIFDNFVAATP